MSEVLQEPPSLLHEAKTIELNHSDKEDYPMNDEQENQNVPSPDSEPNETTCAMVEAETEKMDPKKRNDIFDDESDKFDLSFEQKSSNVEDEKTMEDIDSAKDEDTSTNEVVPKTSIREICSETQRIARKSALSLPYHKPKQRSLLEFLSRKRASTAEGKPSNKDLPNILKVIEDRSQEAETFFGTDCFEPNKICETPSATIASSGNSPHSSPSKQSTEQNTETKLDSCSIGKQESATENPQLRRHSLGSSICLSKIPQKPRLCGRPGDILDLDGDSDEAPKNRTGVAGFVELALQQIALSSKRISTGREKRESIAEAIPETNQEAELSSKGNNEDKSLYPLQRNKLKEVLQNSISEKRAAARLRKQQESKIDNEQEEEEEIEEEEELEFDELSDNDNDASILGAKKKSRKKKVRVNYEDTNDGEQEPSSDEEEAPSSSKLSPEIPESQEEANRSIEAATPDLNPSPSGTKDGKLFSTQSEPDGSFNELLALCSGTFPATGKLVDETDEPEDDGNEGGCTDDVEDTADNENQGSSEKEAKLPSNDDEDSQNPELPSGKSKRKKLLPLLLSDDEDEENNDEEDLQSIKSDDESEAEVKAPTDFFEKEAELSGSELGSDDEREDEEDEWEMEEGDKEEIDEDEVREQVERAHLKTMLDEDQREVRLFQELFLEDGDLHSDGGGRKKQFKWNTSAEGYEREPSQDENNPEELDACDGPDEAAWRKAKNEREKWLQEKGMSVMMDDVKLKTKTVKIVKTKATTKSRAQDTTSDSNALLSSPTKNDAMLKVRRGSFLRRGEKELTDIASLTKVLQPVQAPTASSNFVFASVTPKRNATEKRKVKTEEAGVDVSPRAPPSKKSKIKGATKSVFSFLES